MKAVVRGFSHTRPAYPFLTNEGQRRHLRSRGGDEGASASVTTASLP
jgi:hypothetical protein